MMKHTLTVACISLKSAWQAVSLRSALTALLLAPLAATGADPPRASARDAVRSPTPAGIAADCLLPAYVTLPSGVSPVPGFNGKTDGLEERFLNPTLEDRLGVYWFWSNVTDEQAITRDLEVMAQTGIGRAILSLTKDHSATLKDGTGTVFLSPRFLELFRFALDKAAGLGIRITAIPSNGWYQGGPSVTPEMGPQMLVWSRIEMNRDSG